MATVLTLFVNKLTTPRELSRSELLVNGYYSLSQPKEISNFEFISSNNTKITKDFLKDNWTLVYFGFTNCPDVCPITLNKLDKKNINNDINELNALADKIVI